jgi:DegV family protein with EDD domain
MNMAVKIITDSISYPEKAQAEALGIGLVPISLHFGPNEVYRDLVDLKPQEFYEKLTKVKELPTTSAPSPSQYEDAFRQALDQADEVFCLTVAGNLSMSHQAAIQAKKDLPPDMSDRVIVFDTETTGAPSCLMAIEAAHMANAGASLTTIHEKIAGYLPFAKLVVMFDTLSYIEKSGRCGKVAAIAGNLFHVKPVIYVYRGTTKFFGRPRGITQASRLIFDEFAKDVANATHIHLAFTHANAEQNLEQLKAMIFDKYPNITTEMVPFTTSMGSHAGPGIIGIGYIYSQG